MKKMTFHKVLASTFLLSLIGGQSAFAATPNLQSLEPPTTLSITQDMPPVQASLHTAKQTDAKVELFQDGDFRGQTVSLGTGFHNLNDYPQIGANQLSSLKIPDGYIVTLYVSTGHPYKDFLPGNYNWLNDYNDRINRVEIKHFSPVEFAIEAERVRKKDQVILETPPQYQGAVKAAIASDKSEFSLENPYVLESGTRHEEKQELIFAGKTQLTNFTNQPQTLTSQAFDFSQNNTVTSTVTHGISTSLSANASFNIPVIGNLGTSITTSYNFSTAKANASSTTITYKIPSQSIVVNPGETIEVRARLEKVSVSGDVDLHATLTGQDSGIIYLGERSPWGLWASRGQRSYQFDLKTPIKGRGTYSAEYGSNMYIEVVNISSGQNRSFQLPVSDSISSRSRNGDETLIFDTLPTIDMTNT